MFPKLEAEETELTHIMEPLVNPYNKTQFQYINYVNGRTIRAENRAATWSLLGYSTLEEELNL